MNEIRRRLVVVACCSSLAAAAGAADTKAEGDLRWALNYCVKIRKDMERVRGQDPSAGVISNALERWQADVATTMIYTHVLKRGGRGVRSPLDVLL
ncbi:MAG: hypothetical protein JNK99_05460 [Candidatus Accumulibacter sp.]|uniref:hypothetical protein n=1 Tax=Accumulibacter sp. TaxID=2053492 RepID=UPI001A5851ED|nr:hypothetical protein [Accumulibacter sp.]MBL8394190.1 hypothetical protein [Accumulibacter sp.]